MRKAKKIVGMLLIIFGFAQFFSPEKNDGDVTSIAAFMSETNPNEGIKKVLKESCFDCHSNKTRYPWYNTVTPINYWLNHHVEEGKSELNFSNWASYSLKRKAHKFEEVYEMVEEKEMPLPSYTWTHSEANLSEKQITDIVTWAKAMHAYYKSEIKVQ